MYKNYIFDLYGTLLDIRTDENLKTLWSQMADMYSAYGADYSPEQIRDAYHYLCKSEEARIRRITGSEYPEIDLGQVFIRLLTEAPKTHACENGPKSWSREDAGRWAFHTASIFRILSRQYCHPYEDTIDTLKELKRRGCRIFLLSNAQHMFTMPEMEAAGLMEYFDAVYISSDCLMKKPAMEFMDRLLNEQHLRKSATVMVGNDFSTDIQTAMDHGMDSIFLNTDHLDARERKKRYRAMHDLKEGYMPRIIASGHISEILEEE